MAILRAPLTRESFVGPWAGLVVAWDENDRFDEATTRADVSRLAAAGVPGVYTGGTSGEFYAQTEDEFRTIAAAVVDEVHAGGVLVMVGCTALFTRAVLQRIEYAAAIGADAVQVAAPFWLPLAEHEIVPFFSATAHAAAPMAYSIYETRRARVTLTVAQHRAIHDAAPNYLMVKANADTVGAAVDGCRELSTFVNVFVSEHRWHELATAGVTGSCSSSVYANPSIVLDWFQHLKTKDVEALARDAETFSRLYGHAFRAFAGRGFQDSAWDRLIGNATGFLSASTRARAPYSCATRADVTQLRAWIMENCPQWLWQPDTA